MILTLIFAQYPDMDYDNFMPNVVAVVDEYLDDDNANTLIPQVIAEHRAKVISGEYADIHVASIDVPDHAVTDLFDSPHLGRVQVRS